jgi:hypothetical protein
MKKREVTMQEGNKEFLFHVDDLVKDKHCNDILLLDIKTDSDPFIPLSTDCEGTLYCKMGHEGNHLSLVSLPYDGRD